MQPLRILVHTATSCLGDGIAAHYDALRERRSGLRPNDFTQAPLDTWIGRIDGVEDVPLPAALARWDSRNNRVAWRSLAQDGLPATLAALRARWPATRLGIAVGTSTASIAESERAYRELDAEGRYPEAMRGPDLHQPHSLAAFLQDALDWRGPCLTVSTACSSGAKAWAVGARWLQQGLCDAVLVGGCDTLCGSTLHGFASLGLTAPGPCRPFDRRRDGISIGEAAAFAVLVRVADDDPADALHFAGYGESADAHHMSSPHPQGEGARLAMLAALQRAGATPDEVDYVNLHGTATPANDAVEAAVVAQLFPARPPAASSKGWTGHALGAAGALEASLCLIALEHGLLPGNLGGESFEGDAALAVRADNVASPARLALSNSFGFGGTNASLALRRTGP